MGRGAVTLPKHLPIRPCSVCGTKKKTALTARCRRHKGVGRTYSAESRAKMSATHKARQPAPDLSRAQIDQLYVAARARQVSGRWGCL